MPAPREEIDDAEAEGVEIQVLVAPTRVLGHDGRVVGLECQRMALGPYDDSGRRRPTPIKGSEFVVEVDTVIAAIGQVVHTDFLPGGDGWRTRRGLISTNRRTLATSTPGVFAAGDAVTGPWTLVQAISGGMRAADSIHRYLRGQPLEVVAASPRARRQATPPLGVIANQPRAVMPMLDAAARASTQEEVELGFNLEMARWEASRCLRCDLREESTP
jgi:NADH-quinone oxidoreductase subunit F